MRSLFAWLLIVVGLMLAVGGAGMILMGFLTNHLDVSLAGAGWTAFGAILTFGGFRLRIVPSKGTRR
jgi:hypothetical protein